MNSALHSITVNCVDLDAAAGFYESVFSTSPAKEEAAVHMDLHGVGRLRLESGIVATAAFPRFVVTYILAQPGEVRTVMAAAERDGAMILKPAKKALFGSFAGSFRSPDGVIWKVASQSSKDTAPSSPAPKPIETTVILGVSDPKASVPFYAALGMATDRDYGSKYIDFRPAEGASRLCLMQAPVLAKDVGQRGVASEKQSVTLIRRALLSEEGAEPARGASVDVVIDPDGFRWSSLDEQCAR
ncbi:MAG: hypothetical protein ACRDT7_19235 [Microbacterium sp.]